MIHDFASNLRDLKDYRQQFILVPAKWRAFAPAQQLNWQFTRFSPDSVNDIPAERGIYALVVQFQDHSVFPQVLPTHGYIMYGGITGHEAKTRTLRARFSDYLREKRRAKRHRIWWLLNTWSEDIFFHYSVVGEGTDLRALELALNDAIIPPFVENDFSAEVRRLVRVLRAT
jgi:hypothetical protein